MKLVGIGLNLILRGQGGLKLNPVRRKPCILGGGL